MTISFFCEGFLQEILHLELEVWLGVCVCVCMSTLAISKRLVLGLRYLKQGYLETFVIDFSYQNFKILKIDLHRSNFDLFLTFFDLHS